MMIGVIRRPGWIRRATPVTTPVVSAVSAASSAAGSQPDSPGRVLRRLHFHASLGRRPLVGPADSSQGGQGWGVSPRLADHIIRRRRFGGGPLGPSAERNHGHGGPSGDEDAAEAGIEELKAALKQRTQDADAAAAERITLVGLGLNLFLTGSKLVTGIVAQSTALVADAVHSLTDLISDITTYGAVILSRREPTDNFPYGLLNAEALSAFVVSLTLMSTGGSLCLVSLQSLADAAGAAELSLFFGGGQAGGGALEWINRKGEELVAMHLGSGELHHGATGGTSWADLSMRAGIVLAAAGFVLKEQLYWMTHRLAKRLNSPALEANAWHHRADGFASLVALVGLSGRYMGLEWLDPLAGAVVSAYIVKIGWSLFADSVRQLLDAAPAPAIRSRLDAAVRTVLAKRLDDQVRFHIRSRSQGVFLGVELQIALGLEDYQRCGISLERVPELMESLSEEIFQSIADDEEIRPPPRRRDVQVSFVSPAQLDVWEKAPPTPTA